MNKHLTKVKCYKYTYRLTVSISKVWEYTICVRKRKINKTKIENAFITEKYFCRLNFDKVFFMYFDFGFYFHVVSFYDQNCVHTIEIFLEKLI